MPDSETGVYPYLGTKPFTVSFIAGVHGSVMQLLVVVIELQ